MQRDHFVAQFVSLDPDGRTHFLLALGQELTLVARDVYGPSAYRTPSQLSALENSTDRTYSDDMKLTFARGISELNHKIFGYLRDADETRKYPPDVLVEVLCDIVEGHELKVGFPFVWQRAWSRRTY